MRTFFLGRNEAKWWNTSGPWTAKFTLQPITKVLLLQVEVKVKEEGVHRYIYKHYCQLIQAANYLCHFKIV